MLFVFWFENLGCNNGKLLVPRPVQFRISLKREVSHCPRPRDVKADAEESKHQKAKWQAGTEGDDA